MQLETPNIAENFWEEIQSKPDVSDQNQLKEQEKEKPMTIKEEIQRNINWNQLGEKHIKSSLLIGDLETAMESAFQTGREAEALLIASSDPELFQKAKNKFFHRSKDIFVKNVFSTIINKNFEQLLEQNVLKDWKEYLLYGKTYLSDEEFESFAISMGDKLSSSNDLYSSIVCYILGGNCLKAVESLYNNYQRENSDSFNKSYNLQTLVEQVITIHYCLQEDTNNKITNKIIIEYSQLLVTNGLFTEACTFLIKVKDQDLNTMILFDRVYGNFEDKLSQLFKKPAFPFNEVNVKAKAAQQPQSKKPKGLVETKSPNTGLSQVKSHSSQGNKLFGAPQEQPVMEMPKKPKQNPFPGKQRMTQEEDQLSESQISHKSVSSTNPLFTKPQKPILNPPKPIFNPPILHQQEETGPSFQKASEFPQPRTLPTSKVHKLGPPPLKKEPQMTQMPPKTEQRNEIPSVKQTQSVEMDADEEFIYSSFERLQNLYNSVFQDDNKQKDMANKILVLHNKLRNHELKINILKLLINFINGMFIYLAFDAGTPFKEMKSICTKIQSNQWDQNKSWMPLLEKLISMPRNK